MKKTRHHLDNRPENKQNNYGDEIFPTSNSSQRSVRFGDGLRSNSVADTDPTKNNRQQPTHNTPTPSEKTANQVGTNPTEEGEETIKRKSRVKSMLDRFKKNGIPPTSFGSDDSIYNLYARGVLNSETLLADTTRSLDQKLERYVPNPALADRLRASTVTTSLDKRDWPCKKEFDVDLKAPPSSAKRISSHASRHSVRDSRTAVLLPTSDANEQEPKRWPVVRSRRGNAGRERVQSTRSDVRDLLSLSEHDYKMYDNDLMRPYLRELAEACGQPYSHGQQISSFIPAPILPQEQTMSAHSRRCLARRLFVTKKLANEMTAKGFLGRQVSPYSQDSLPWSYFLTHSLMEELPATHIAEPEYKLPSTEPHKMTVEELLEYAYHIIKWTPEELVYRERNICYCLHVLNIDNLQEMTFSNALEIYLKSSPLGIFLEQFNEGGDFGYYSNIYKYDTLEMDEKAEKLLNQEHTHLAITDGEEGDTSSDAMGMRQFKGSDQSHESSPSTADSKQQFEKTRQNSSRPVTKSKMSSRPKSPQKKTKQSSSSSSKLSKTASKESVRNRRNIKGRPKSKEDLGDPDEQKKEDKEEEKEREEQDKFHEELMNIILRTAMGTERFINPIVLPQIRRLRLVGCNMTIVDKGAHKMEGLLILSLALNWIKEIHGIVLPRKLGFLELFCNLITDVGPLIKNMPPCLMYLGLARNKLTDQSNLHLLGSDTNGRLRSLDLGDNDICSLEDLLAALSCLPHLLALRLHGNPCSTVAAYRELTLHSLPKLVALDDCILWPKDRPKHVKKADEELYQDGSRHGAFVASLIRILGVPMPEEETVENRKVQHLYHVEMELPLLDPHFRKPIAPPDDVVSLKTPSGHGTIASSSQLAMTSLAAPQPPPPTPASHITLHNPDLRQSESTSTLTATKVLKDKNDKPVTFDDHVESEPNSERSRLSEEESDTAKSKRKKGSRGKKSSERRKKSRSSTRSTSKKGDRKSRIDKYLQSQSQSDLGKQEDTPELRASQLMNTSDIVGEVLSWGRHALQPTAYESSPCEWNPVMEAGEPVVVVAPNDDLLALRDTFRTHAAIRIVHARILPPEKKKKGKGKGKGKGKSKKKSKGKKKSKSPKKKSKSLKSGSSTSPSVVSSKSSSVAGKKKKKGSGESSEEESRKSATTKKSDEGQELSRECLGSFWIPLHQPMWYERHIEYEWSINDENDIAHRATESLKDMFPRPSSKGGDSKGKKGKKGKKKKEKKGKKKRSGSRTSSSSKSSTTKKVEIPEELTVHLAFGLRRLNEPEYKLPQDAHEHMQKKRASSRRRALKKKSFLVDSDKEMLDFSRLSKSPSPTPPSSPRPESGQTQKLTLPISSPSKSKRVSMEDTGYTGEEQVLTEGVVVKSPPAADEESDERAAARAMVLQILGL